MIDKYSSLIIQIKFITFLSQEFWIQLLATSTINLHSKRKNFIFFEHSSTLPFQTENVQLWNVSYWNNIFAQKWRTYNFLQQYSNVTFPNLILLEIYNNEYINIFYVSSKDQASKKKLEEREKEREREKKKNQRRS